MEDLSIRKIEAHQAEYAEQKQWKVLTLLSLITSYPVAYHLTTATLQAISK